MSYSSLAIRRVDRSQEAILRNLLELYCHDMAEWLLLDAQEDGTYRYPCEKVWDAGLEVYFAYVGRIPVGFGLVGSAEPYVGDAGVKDLEEFFVVRRHRRSGIGRALATYLWDQYPGRWLVRVYQGNPPAMRFWREAIAQYTAGRFGEEVRIVADRSWSYFTFEAGDGPTAGPL